MDRMWGSGRIRRLIAAALACALIAASAHAAAELSAGESRRVRIDGRTMHIVCAGHGEPTVILDAGLGDSSLVWTRVMPGLATMTRVCRYDRAGYGDSELGPPPRTSATIVDELETLLARAGIEPPWLPVGHSFGGWNMQLFAARNPDDVAALVLVDSSQVDEIERYERELGMVIAPRDNAVFTLTPQIPSDLPPAAAERARAQITNPAAMRTVYREWRGFRASEREVAAATLPDLPLVVLSRGAPIADPDSRRGRSEALWRRLQREFVARHPQAVHIVAGESGHYIQLEQPALVVHGVCVALRRIADDHRACALPAAESEQRAAAR